MTLLALLQKLFEKANGPNVQQLVGLLQTIGARAPDLKPQTDEILAKLNAAVTPEGLVALAQLLPPEIANIARGKFDKRSHAGDAI